MKKARPTTAKSTAIRVGIYCRQSVASDLEFGSIDAQREAVEAYVTSMRAQGWVALPERYDDHGFSGGTTDRPAFQRLLADVEAGKIDVVATYRYDRASRCMADFATLLARLEKKGIAFVSITERFDTSTPVGRLGVTLVAGFGQYEREVISARTRDKIRATRMKGMFTGGRPVLGYDVHAKRLVVNQSEAEVVRTIFSLYLQHGGLVATAAELRRRGVRNKSWITKTGKHVIGEPFDKSTLRTLLVNPVYAGRVRAGNDVVAGQHEAIVDDALFDAVATLLREHRRPYRATVGKWGALLSGVLRCACGAAMTHAVNVRGARVHRYYTCRIAQVRGAAACPGSRAPAAELEEVVVQRIHAIGADASVLAATIASAQQNRNQHEPDLVAEAQRLTSERTQLTGQRNNLLDALQHGGSAADSIVGRLAAVDGQLGRLQARHDEVAAQLAAVSSEPINEADIRAALQQFTTVWNELVPRERARVLRLLVDEVRYDGPAGEVEIRFRDNGIRALGDEVTERRPA